MVDGDNGSVLSERCRTEDRVLVLDLDFANVQAYHPNPILRCTLPLQRTTYCDDRLFIRGRRSPRVDDRDASGSERSCVACSYDETTGCGNGRNLGVRNSDRMTMPSSACNNLRVGLCPSDIEGHDPLGEQRDDLFVEGTAECSAAFAGREACDTGQQLGQAHGREVETLHRLRVEPCKHASVGVRPHRLGDHVRIEQDHARFAGFAGFLSLLISSSRPPNPALCHGRACVRGTRVLVSAILDNVSAGVSREELLRNYADEKFDEANF